VKLGLLLSASPNPYYVTDLYNICILYLEGCINSDPVALPRHETMVYMEDLPLEEINNGIHIGSFFSLTDQILNMQSLQEYISYVYVLIL
jgi:hypothetical protein